MKSPKEIYQSLGKSKTWFFKWLKRYKLDGKDWAKSHSCKPHKSPKRIDEMMEQMVIETRKHLEKSYIPRSEPWPLVIILTNRE